MPQCPQALEPWVTKCIFGVIYDQPILMSPGGNGGPNWAPMAFSPRTGFFYVTAADRPQSRILRGLGKTVDHQWAPSMAHAHRRRFPQQQDRLQKRTPYSIGQGSGASRPQATSCFMASPTASPGLMTPGMANCCGSGRPAPVQTRPPSPTRSTARICRNRGRRRLDPDHVGQQRHDLGVLAQGLAGRPAQAVRGARPPEKRRRLQRPVARTSEIKIDDYTYAPLRITVTAGTTVKFTNNGAQPHNATSSDGGGFDTGLLAKGETATVTFNRPAATPISGTPHPSMVGQIIVTGQAVAKRRPP